MTTTATIIDSIANAVKPWAGFYADSKPASIVVLFLHLGGLVFAGGTAIATDRATLKALRGTTEDRSRALLDLETSHGWVLTGLALIFTSGLGLALSDVKTFAYSPVYWTKMALIVLLLINGAILQRTERRLRAVGFQEHGGPSPDGSWSRLRYSAIASLTLWTGIVLAGVILSQSS